MKIKVNEILVISLVIFCFSCRNGLSDENKRTFEKEFGIISDTMVKDLPNLKPDKHSSAYSTIDVRNNLVGFSSMENGADSIKIRLWYLYQVGHTEHVIEIENVNKKWIFSQYTLRYKYDQIHDSVIFAGQNVHHENPNSGNERFIQKLFELGILTLPSHETLQDYSVPTDVGRIDVEIASKNKFRFYDYRGPYGNIHRNGNAKK